MPLLTYFIVVRPKLVKLLCAYFMYECTMKDSFQTKLSVHDKGWTELYCICITEVVFIFNFKSCDVLFLSTNATRTINVWNKSPIIKIVFLLTKHRCLVVVCCKFCCILMHCVHKITRLCKALL